MNFLKKIILITAGDPASIASEITLKAINSTKINKNIYPVVITNKYLFKNIKRITKINLSINEIKDIKNFVDYKNNCLNIIPIEIEKDVVLGKPNTKNCDFVKNSIVKSVKILTNSSASAIVTNPINKNIMHKSGFNFSGHTDFLASLSLKKTPVMMLVGKNLKTIPLTIHVPIKEVSKLISKELILSTINIAANNLSFYFGIKKPRIIITGLNPHAGENGDIGVEEEKIIIPALNEARKSKCIELIGPVSADTAFSNHKRKQYDLAICMYHDQALIPIKTLDFYNAVNVTLGLDFIRTSPDHGTGFDIAGKNKADPTSLISAINLAYLMSKKNE